MSNYYGEDDEKKGNTYIGDDDLIVNTASRLPVCLCLDISGSMNRDNAIAQLNEGVKAFYEAIKADEQARMSCEIAVVAFNSEVHIEERFSLVDQKHDIELKADGGTALAHAVEAALDLLQDRKQEYRENGVDYYQPWLVIMTDGKPGDVEDVPAAQERTRKLEEEKKLTVFSIAVGNDNDEEKFRKVMDVLSGFSKRRAKHLKDLKFSEFFAWLGKSVSVVSQSKVGDRVQLDMTTVDDWSEI